MILSYGINVPSPVRRSARARDRLNGPTTAARRRTTRLVLLPLPTRFVADHPIRATDCRFFWILTQQKAAPQRTPPLWLGRQRIIPRIDREQGIILAFSVSPATGPTVFPRPIDQARDQRIPLKVTATTQQVLVGVYDRTLAPALEQVPDQPIPPPVMVPVGHQQPRQQRRQLARIGQLQQEVKIVVHQAIVIEPKPEAIALALQQPQEMEAVVIVVEDRRARVPAVEDVVAGGMGPHRRERALRGMVSSRMIGRIGECIGMASGGQAKRTIYSITAVGTDFCVNCPQVHFPQVHLQVHLKFI